MTVLPLRVGVVWLQRRFLVGEDARGALNVGVALAPTLIFTLVLATILREHYSIPDSWYGGLLVYAALSTFLPTLVLAKPFDIDLVLPERAGAHAAPAAAAAAADGDAAPAEITPPAPPDR